MQLVIILQYISVSNQHIAHLKLIQYCMPTVSQQRWGVRMVETKISSSSSLQGLRLGLDSQDTLPFSLLLDFKSKVCFVCLLIGF